MHGAVDARVCRRRQGRVALVAACAYNEIGLELGNELFRFYAGGDEVVRRFDVGKGVFTVKTVHINVGDFVARFFYDIVFDSAGGAYEKYFRFGLIFANRIRNGDGGVDMPARAAAGEN